MIHNLLLIPLSVSLLGPTTGVGVPQTCVKTPFQISGHIDVPATNGLRFAFVTTTIRLPAMPIEIQHVDVRLRNPNDVFVWLASAQVTTQLATTVVTHGLEITFTGGTPSLVAIPRGEGDLSRDITLFADPSSPLRFDAVVQVTTGTDVSSIEFAVVGQAVTTACWGQ
jgi:hypothetical protein